MKVVNLVRNYLPHETCDILNTWVRDQIDEGNINYGITKTGYYKDTNEAQSYHLRYSSRIDPSKIEYPQLVRDLHEQIQNEFRLGKWSEPKHIHGKDGVVVSATLPGGNVYLHKDPRDGQEPKHTLRCNILTSETEGGLIWVNGESYKLKKGDMMQYLVSKYEHKVDSVIGNPGDMRIMWMFGWYVDDEEWEASIQD